MPQTPNTFAAFTSVSDCDDTLGEVIVSVHWTDDDMEVCGSGTGDVADISAKTSGLVLIGHRLWKGGWNADAWDCENIRSVILEDIPENIIADETSSDGLVPFGDWRDMGCSLELFSRGVKTFGDFLGVEKGFGDKVVTVNGIPAAGIEIMGEGDKTLKVSDLRVGVMHKGSSRMVVFCSFGSCEQDVTKSVVLVSADTPTGTKVLVLLEHSMVCLDVEVCWDVTPIFCEWRAVIILLDFLGGIVVNSFFLACFLLMLVIFAVKLIFWVPKQLTGRDVSIGSLDSAT